MRRKAIGRSFACGLSVLVAACGGSGSGGSDSGVPVGAVHQYVSNQIKVPVAATDVDTYGLDIDGDGAIKDNALGAILQFIGTLNVDVQGPITTSVNSGSLVILHEVQADALDNWGDAGWQVYLGLDHSFQAPSFDGTDLFTKDTTQTEQLSGNIIASTFRGGPGTVTIRLPLSMTGAPLEVNLVGARIEAQVSATSCDGKLGGAIKQSDLETNLLPAVASLINDYIANDLGCQEVPPNCSMATMLLLSEFDADGDGVVTVAEIQASTFAALLEPDIDLFDASGAFNPRQDGVQDSLSLGIGFTCVPASF